MQTKVKDDELALAKELFGDGIRIKGMYHVVINEKGKIVGDSGWLENQVCNDGFNDYLCRLIAGTTGSKQITHIALGTGTAPGAAATTLPGELAENVRKAITAATSSTSKTIRLTATFGSSDNFVTATRNISNIGLFHQSTGGTIFAGNTYNSSSCATNQDVNVTYDIIFS